MTNASLVVGTAALNQTPLDFSGNQQRIIAAIVAARKQGVVLLNLPELGVSGYGCEDMFLSLWTLQQAEQSLQAILTHTQNMVVTLGLPVYFEGSVYNAVAVCWDGRILGVNAKKMLPREGLHYEPRWFRAWPRLQQSHIVLCGQSVPFGDHIYAFDNVRFALEICEEAWGSELGAAAFAARGCDIILNSSASHFAIGKQATRRSLVANNSRALGAYYLYANLLGNEAGRVIYDGSLFIACAGDIIAEEQSFAFSDYALLTAAIDLAKPRHFKLKNRSVVAPVASSDQQVATVAVSETLAAGKKAAAVLPAAKAMDANEEFARAVILGLGDYLRKSRAQGFVVSLSGGCDSAVVASLCAHFFAEALRMMSPDEVGKRWHLAPPEDAKNPRAWIKKYLSLVYQGTENSGQVTRQAARSVAEELGATFSEVEVGDLAKKYVSLGETVLGRKLDWQSDDIALQNIQARTRAPLVWLLANVKNALLLTTSNRSEAAVGYATMDGDTAGSLAPIAGVSKHFLRQWLRWAEQDCLLGLGPLKALRFVNEQAPTAELRPSASVQTDETDLMPYDVMEAIEELFMRERLGPNDLRQQLQTLFPHLSDTQSVSYVDKFFALWTKNQWKRERFAPSFHLDDISFDSRTWCRFPILSGKLS